MQSTMGVLDMENDIPFSELMDDEEFLDLERDADLDAEQDWDWDHNWQVEYEIEKRGE